jgi:two-component system sensor histidine kinase DegS
MPFHNPFYEKKNVLLCRSFSNKYRVKKERQSLGLLADRKMTNWGNLHRKFPPDQAFPAKKFYQIFDNVNNGASNDGEAVIKAREEERKRIARELHDGVAQNLAGLLVLLEVMEEKRSNKTLPDADLDKLKDIISETLCQVRSIMYDLRPVETEGANLGSLLWKYFTQYKKRYGFEVNLKIVGKIKRYDPVYENAAFRLVQEAINNSRKHSGVNQAQVILEDKGYCFQIIITDKGSGFDPEKVWSCHEHLGIKGMAERVGLLGGEMDIRSSKGKGTRIHIKMPLEGEVANGKSQGSYS